MKRVAIFLFVFTRVLFINAQAYQSLFGSNTTAWKIVVENLDNIGTDSIRTAGDTIVNSLNYKKILGNFPICCNMLVGLLREDTLNGKAWFYSTINGNDVEKLIMDLNLAVGDSIHLVSYYPDTGFIFIDSVYFSSGKKYVRLNTTVNQYGWGGFGEKLLFIEGVGTNRCIQYLDPYSLNASSYLLCSYKDSQLVYTNTNPNFNQCDLWTSVSEQENNKLKAKISPNPITDISFLTYSNPNHSKFILYIYDLIGRIVSQYTSTSDSFEIKKEDYNQGIFIYHLVDIPNNTSVNNMFIIY